MSQNIMTTKTLEIANSDVRGDCFSNVMRHVLLARVTFQNQQIYLNNVCYNFFSCYI